LLDDAVAAYLDAVSERAFDEPLMALLRARGFASVRLVHGAREFGKDVIAQRDGEQWGFQSKVGNIGQSEWRTLTGQFDELRVVNLGHGAFNTNLPRRPVLVTTGRLVGNAPELYGDHNTRAKGKGEPELGLWDRDILLSQLAGDPESVLRGSIDGQLMSMLGAAEARTVTMRELEVFSRRWMTWDLEPLAGLGVIEAALVREKLRGVDRLDLACHLALCLMRAVWASGAAVLPGDVSAPAARSLFEAYARALWDRCGDELLEHPLLNEIEFGGWATYPVRCVRLAEILGLLALLVKESDPELSTEISRWLVTLCEKQPGVAHPISDQYAVSVIPAVLALATVDREAAKTHLKRCTVWLCDRYERDALGLAREDATPEEEVEYLMPASRCEPWSASARHHRFVTDASASVTTTETPELDEQQQSPGFRFVLVSDAKQAPDDWTARPSTLAVHLRVRSVADHIASPPAASAVSPGVSRTDRDAPCPVSAWARRAAFAALLSAFFCASWRACCSIGTTISGRSRPKRFW